MGVFFHSDKLPNHLKKTVSASFCQMLQSFHSKIYYLEKWCKELYLFNIFKVKGIPGKTHAVS